MVGTLCHGSLVERKAMPPHVVARLQRADVAIGDAIGVGARERVKTRGCTRRGPIDVHERDICRQQGVHGPNPASPRDKELICRSRNTHVLSPRMHAGIGPAGTGHIDRSSQERLERSAHLAGDRGLRGLFRKPAVGGPVIGDFKEQGPFEVQRRIRLSLRGHRFAARASRALSIEIARFMFENVSSVLMLRDNLS